MLLEMSSKLARSYSHFHTLQAPNLCLGDNGSICYIHRRTYYRMIQGSEKVKVSISEPYYYMHNLWSVCDLGYGGFQLMGLKATDGQDEPVELDLIVNG